MKFKAKIYLEYNDVLSMCHNLEHDVSKMHPDLIVGIARGGLLPALHLSHGLNIPMMSIQWQTRDAEIKEIKPEIIQALKENKTVVFVDDINDTGRTFEEIKNAYGGGKYVCLIERGGRTGTTFRTNARSLRFEDNRWVVFPWEKD